MKQLLKFSIILMVLFSCKREKTEFIGPAFISAPSGFEVLNFTATPPLAVDFTASDVKFNAVFTHSVTWKLTMTGQESGAIYVIEGISKELNNVSWIGTHKGLNFFRTGENVTATLSFFGTKLTSSLTINIIEARDFTTYGLFANWGDFEDPTKIIPSNLWYPFTGTGATFGCDSTALDYNGDPVPSVQGEKYYFLKGLGLQPVFVGGIQTGAIGIGLPPTPDNIWVNMYIYGSGDNNAGVELEYQEADADGTSGGYQGTDDDAFTAKFTINHRGWKLFSFKYSSLTPSLNASFGGSGNKIHEPEKLTSFDLVLVKKTNPDAPIEVYFDYPIITIGGPFDPSK